ncbi:hypothetical protein IWX46DRAFT_426191 [Phyllosticta citricarpa]|uniref:Uncharacterized protein n=1 Tax=Phyllosticta citricarpa TaxID=55181 RepID=A0ABR1MJC1_9PEZI
MKSYLTYYLSSTIHTRVARKTEPEPEPEPEEPARARHQPLPLSSYARRLSERLLNTPLSLSLSLSLLQHRSRPHHNHNHNHNHHYHHHHHHHQPFPLQALAATCLPARRSSRLLILDISATGCTTTWGPLGLIHRPRAALSTRRPPPPTAPSTSSFAHLSPQIAIPVVRLYLAPLVCPPRPRRAQGFAALKSPALTDLPPSRSHPLSCCAPRLSREANFSPPTSTKPRLRCPPLPLSPPQPSCRKPGLSRACACPALRTAPPALRPIRFLHGMV